MSNQRISLMSNIWNTSMIYLCLATTKLSLKTIILWKQLWETKISPMKVLSTSKSIKQRLISNELTLTVIVIQGSRQPPSKAFQVHNAKINNNNTNRCSTYIRHTWKNTFSPLNQRVLSVMINFPITVQAWTWIKLLMLVKAGILSSTIHRRSNCKHQWVPGKNKSTLPIKPLQEWHQAPKLKKTRMSPSSTSKPNK
jgi:hypothetical protein